MANKGIRNSVSFEDGKTCSDSPDPLPEGNIIPVDANTSGTRSKLAKIGKRKSLRPDLNFTNDKALMRLGLSYSGKGKVR